MIKIEMPETVETEADWMIYSNLQEKLLLSPKLKFRLVAPNQLECSASLVAQTVKHLPTMQET